MRLAPPLVATLALAILCCCGEPAPTQVTVLPPALAEAAGCPAATFGSAARATLHVSGNFAPCALTTDAAGQMTGECPDIPAGVVRQLVLAYALAEAGDPNRTVPLLYLFRALDLTPAALAGESRRLEVRFDEAASVGSVKNADDLAGLAGSDSTEAGDRATRDFARVVIGNEDLDFDDDGCANLDEACNNHLFDGTPGC